MRNSKNTILLLIVVVLFVASGTILYRGIFADGQASLNDIVGGPGAKKEIVNILPYGTSLDFQHVQSWTVASFAVIPEPVDPNSVGVDVHALISPAQEGSVPLQVNAVQQPNRPVQ